MDWNLNTLKQNLCYDLSEHEIIQALKALKQVFVYDRDQIESYTEDPRLVGAYGLVYMPTNSYKLPFVLDQLPEPVKARIKDSQFIDLGTGTGTYLFSFLDWSENKRETHLGIDRAGEMLKQARQFRPALFPEYKVEFGTSLPAREDKNRTLCFGNVLNEMEAEEALNLITGLDPEFVIFIEPGTSELFQKISKVRTELLKLEYTIHYPCRSSEACPALQKEGEWCHQVLRMTHDPDIERLCQKAQLDRKVMPFTAHVYQKAGEIDNGGKALLMRFISEAKHAFTWQICMEENGANVIKTFEIPKKTLSKSEQKEFKKLSVGAVFDYEVTKKVREDFFRIKVKSIN